MAFVTRVTFQSGDRQLLDDVVDDVKHRAQRKGVELKGPHPKPPTDYRVALSKRLLPGGGEFEPWHYSVYTRTIEIVGHDEFARTVAEDRYPERIRLEAEIEQR